MNAILAIETSVAKASVALWLDNNLVLDEQFSTDRNHNSMIFSPLKKVKDILGSRKLNLTLAGIGPGSYSGTRVGIAAIQGMAIVNECPSVGLSSLAATPEARKKGDSFAIGDARRGLYYISKILPSGEAAEAELMPTEIFHKRLEELLEDRLFSLDSPEKLNLPAHILSRVIQTRSEAKYLLKIWSDLGIERQKELQKIPLAPAYLRPPFTSKAKAGHPLLRKN